MIICGLKLTHDGAVALLDNDSLVFSVEMEKIDNNPRYSEIADFQVVERTLKDFGYKPEDVDQWAVDGWDGCEAGYTSLTLREGKPETLRLAPYHENDSVTSILRPGWQGVFQTESGSISYHSYVHLAGHLASAYCTSPFARNNESSFALVWDGGCFPRLYYVDPQQGVENGGYVFPLIGHAYAICTSYFGPYRREEKPSLQEDLSVAGKLMAYVALGNPVDEVIEVLREEFTRYFESDTSEAVHYRNSLGGWGTRAEEPYVHAFYRSVATRLGQKHFTDEDVLASIHQFFEELLVERVAAKVRQWKGEGPWNLCFVGGCALNIKWNSALRSHPIFRSVWVPPFPNDSGSAIGAACAHLMATDGIGPLAWHARLGPDIKPSEPLPGWAGTRCSPAELGQVLHETGEPVVVVHDRAELGPRALGRRSILAAATDAAMKDRLNTVKGREYYRPVAPVCLVEHAPEIFSPGTPDPLMLFDHTIRSPWAERIPAIVHLDGTARLQTVGEEDDPTLRAVLSEYHRLSGIPVLCNTSANFNGRGFFPDAVSAMKWGKVSRVWSEGVLYLLQESVRD
ncbi:carbamoyltransferase N-terminal domain-containing protein [Streptomyces sp. NPDC049585]|uniref:carbamoyltransferase N-terminal domain-containing protein n=1 Tax=Streptomyces sp. NPDC049585 TaxID=3155154 RepID=UPI003417FA67